MPNLAQGQATFGGCQPGEIFEVDRLVHIDELTGTAELIMEQLQGSRRNRLLAPCVVAPAPMADSASYSSVWKHPCATLKWPNTAWPTRRRRVGAVRAALAPLVRPGLDR